VTPVATSSQPAWIVRPSLGKPILLLALLCAFLLPLSGPAAGGALTGSTSSGQFYELTDSLLDRQFIQQEIAHIATHPKTGVAFLTAFLTESERLCQPHVRQSPNFPCPNATSPLLSDAAAIALPASLTLRWRPSRSQIGMEALGRPDGMLDPPEPPPPRSFASLK